ncbi:uncharacterized protein [Asterias amurensis]|uniref:uncharacterized protein isoform X2 n=1 Tax=Asterias amurensis TaxID=7602 RepID=UPI003AB47D69
MENIMASIMLVLLGVLILNSSSESESLPGCLSTECTKSTKSTEKYNFTQCEIQEENSDDGCSSAQHKHSTKNCCCECPEGTFMAKRNTCNYCRNHTKCDPNQELESNGTFVEDRKCKCRSFPISYEDCKRINCTDFPADMTTKRPDTFTSTAQPDVSGDPLTPKESECKRINCTDFPADMTTKRPDTFTSTTQPDVSGDPLTPKESEDPKGSWPESAIGVVGIVSVICVIEFIIIIIFICQRKQRHGSVNNVENQREGQPLNSLPPSSDNTR